MNDKTKAKTCRLRRFVATEQDARLEPPTVDQIPIVDSVGNPTAQFFQWANEVLRRGGKP
jgi:hypothetical protein